MTAQAGKSAASLLAKGRASAPLSADLQVSWPESASRLVAPAEKGATKAGWRKCGGKIVFPPRLFISGVKFVIQFIMDFWGEGG